MRCAAQHTKLYLRTFLAYMKYAFSIVHIMHKCIYKYILMCMRKHHDTTQQRGSIFYWSMSVCRAVCCMRSQVLSYIIFCRHHLCTSIYIRHMYTYQYIYGYIIPLRVARALRFIYCTILYENNIFVYARAQTHWHVC